MNKVKKIQIPNDIQKRSIVIFALTLILLFIIFSLIVLTANLQYLKLRIIILFLILAIIITTFVIIMMYFLAKSIYDIVFSLMENLNKNEPFKKTLQYIYDTFLPYIPYKYIGVALIEDDNKSITAVYAATGEKFKNLPKRLLGYKTRIDNTSLAKILDTGHVRVINDLEEYVKGKKLTEYNRILLEEGIKSSITFPLKNNNKYVGIIFFSSDTKNVYKQKHIKFLKALSNSIMLSLEEDKLIEDMVVSSTLSLAVLTEERDPETGKHVERMSEYSKMLAEFMAKDDMYNAIIDMDYIKDIERFSPLHDIGKVAIQDNILLKPGKLTKEEFEIMKTHAAFGGRVLKMADENLKKSGRTMFDMGIEIAESHHEKWDGSGYPYGKNGMDIPLCARIVAICDVFDALTSKRPYKEPFSFDESLRIIYEDSGKHFDPNILRIFIEHKEAFKNMYEQYRNEDEGTVTT